MSGSRFLRGLRDGLPIGLGYLSVAFAFGIQALSCGLSPLQALLISMTNVTSAGQLAGITLIAQAAPLTEMALTQLTINLRYALMSLSLSQKMDGSMNVLRRMIFAFCNTDEIFAVASAQEGRLGHVYLYGLMIAPYFGWSLGTVLGAAAGRCSPSSSAQPWASPSTACSWPSLSLPRGKRRTCGWWCSAPPACPFSSATC